MTSLGYYPGCSLGGTAAEYGHSLLAVAAKLNIQLQEVPDWVCCGATSAHAVDHEAAICLAADTLLKAGKAGLTKVLAPCAMCYQRLATVAHEVSQEPALGQRLAKAFDDQQDLTQIQALSILNWVDEMSDDAIKQRVVKPLAGLKVACYYGCLLVRPPKITGCKNPEAPRSMERIVTLLGGEPVRWSMATECCGASFALSRKESVIRQNRKIYDAARKAGAEVMCLACPMCHANFDMRQGEYTSAGESSLPAVYLTQLMGVAMGVSKSELGLGGHFVPVEPALAKVS